MTKIPFSRLVAATSLLAVPAILVSQSAAAKPAKSSRASAAKSKTRLAALPSGAASTKNARSVGTAPLPRYVSMATIKRLQKQNKEQPLPVLQPMWEGHALKTPMRDLLTGPTLDLPPVIHTRSQKTGKGVEPTRLAQAFPRPIPPAPVRGFRSVGRTVTPRWVRYPLEFQLAGIGLGTRAVDKDAYNRIDRYGLFALHGNPTAVVRSTSSGVAAPTGGSAPTGGAGDAAGKPDAAAGAAPGGSDLGAQVASSSGSTLTLQQTPPEVASLFPGSQQGGGLPDWALAITVKLDNNHVEWLYKRETYSMGFVVDRLGFVDAIIVAGLTSDISRTQLEDPVHTVKLGDDLRKVLFRYGYPDDLVPLASDPAASADATTGAPGGNAQAAAQTGAAVGADVAANEAVRTGDPAAAAADGAAAGQPAGVEAAGAGANAAYRTFDLRYEQSYNVVFTIRNNRVVRIYIFGDPDFFNAQRRNLIRAKY